MKNQLHARRVIGTLLVGVALLLAGCEGTPPTQVAQNAAPVFTPSPTLKPTAVPTPAPTMTARQQRHVRFIKRRAERAEQRARLADEKQAAIKKGEDEYHAKQEAEVIAANQQKRDAEDGIVTADEYNKIQMGMSLGQVMDIIGPGKEISRTSIGGTSSAMYSWENPGGANMNAMFQDDALISKAQFGIL